MVTMIAIGKSLMRKLIVSTDKECFIVNREKFNEITIWVDGLSAAEGKDLIENYKKLPANIFGRYRNQMFREHQNEGYSERGLYNKDEFSDLLLNCGIDIGRNVSDQIYNILFNDEIMGLQSIG